MRCYRIRRNEIVWVLIVVIYFAIGIFAYPHMPERMATHWNEAGGVDGYSRRFWGVFLLPLIYMGVVLFLIAIPRIDPLKANIQQFRRYYDGFIFVFSAFFLGVFLQVILWNVGVRVNPNVLSPIGIGLLFYYLGILCEHARRNWFIGIRTPWTLSNENVWNKTHRNAANLFKTAAVIAALGAFFGSYALFFVLIPVVAVAAYTFVYSYLEYQRETKQSGG